MSKIIVVNKIKLHYSRYGSLRLLHMSRGGPLLTRLQFFNLSRARRGSSLYTNPRTISLTNWFLDYSPYSLIFIIIYGVGKLLWRKLRPFSIMVGIFLTIILSPKQTSVADYIMNPEIVHKSMSQFSLKIYTNMALHFRQLNNK